MTKALIESGLGTAVIGGGLSDELKQATFSAGLKGVKPDDVPAVEALVQSTLAQVAIAGFDADAVEASTSMHRRMHPPPHTYIYI